VDCNVEDDRSIDLDGGCAGGGGTETGCLWDVDSYGGREGGWG
jgi:hypothetical protein